jgi:hypothetical protein
MQALREATVAGFNEFVRSQLTAPGSASLKLVQFDDQYEVVFDHPLTEVPLLTQDTFVPRGMTALLDAQGRTIEELGAELAAMPESERPSKVMVLTLTDGLENASKVFSAQRVADLVKQQREVYKWEFVYLGANQDAVQVAATMNIPAAMAMSYSPAPGSARRSLGSAGALFQRVRSGEKAAFSEADRTAAMAED